MEDAWNCVTAQGFGARTLPVPLYLRAHAGALVRMEHADEELDLAGADIPLLDVAVAAGRGEALWQLAESAAALRFRDDGRGAGFGAGADRDTAVVRGLHAELARLPAGSDPLEGTLITGWEQAVAPLRGVAGRIDCYLLGEAAGIPRLGAVLHLDRMPVSLHAVVCDVWRRRGVERAVHAVLRRFVIASLARLEAGDGDGEDQTAAPDVVTVGRTPFADLEPAPPPDELAELRTRLRSHGYLARTRILSAEGHPVVAACRLDLGEPGVGGRDGWEHAPPPRLRAPRQTSLAYTPDQVRAGRVYHENSKMRTAFGVLPVVDVSGMGPQARMLLGRAFRDFGHTRREYPLRARSAPALLPLDETVRRRRSWAPMGGGELGVEELTHLLTLSYGTTGSAAVGEDVRLPLRATPSAGGLYSTDLFVLVSRVEGVEPGLYYFHPGRRVLQLVDDSPTLDEVSAYTGYQGRVGEAAALVIYVGAFRRNQWKYLERGYRTVLLDCGHLAQSVVITAGALGLVAHPMIAFIDDYFNELIGVDGVDDAVLYLTLLGPRPADEADEVDKADEADHGDEAKDGDEGDTTA